MEQVPGWLEDRERTGPIDTDDVVNAQTDELGQERSYTAADIENASRFD